MNNGELIPHLFRIEYRKIVSVLCQRFGSDRVEVAEDIASETFLTAAQSWGLNGIPPNPSAWLYNVARNKAVTWLGRERVFNEKVLPEWKRGAGGDIDIDLSPQNIYDSQLRMMFVICHPSIPIEAQAGLALRILCGFGIGEIADAFLSNKETINKRLFRARERLREEKIPIELPGPIEITHRLEGVLTTLYLLFNEGYYSVSQDMVLRKELCFEAMRLTSLLLENPSTDQPAVNALMALMCFHASRFDARLDSHGGIILYDRQDPGQWNTDLIGKGGYFLHKAATGDQLTKYHLQAGIAYWNTQQADTPEKWENILQLYNQLLLIEYSPIAALNRTYALSKANGKEAAIREAEQLGLVDNHFYYVLLGELYTGIDNGRALQHFQKALILAKTLPEQRVIREKIASL